MLIRKSGRSTDFISPSFGFGCLLDCLYCYMKRHTNDNSLSIAKNVNQILSEINNHVMWLPEKESNQTDKKYWTYDISCNEDFALHSKHHNWMMIFDFFVSHDRIKASFATKIVPYNFLEYNPHKKIRIRFSLMPQRLSDLLEPHSSKIEERIKAIDVFNKAGYEVHINYSPIVIYEGWIDDYIDLFNQVNKNVKIKDDVLCECIFLTHNKSKHTENLLKNELGESLLWKPSIQEDKRSEYGGENIRYKSSLKKKYIEKFKEIHKKTIPWNKIRYIF